LLLDMDGSLDHVRDNITTMTASDRREWAEQAVG